MCFFSGKRYKRSIDLTLKESHEGYHALSKCRPSVGYTELVNAERKRSSPTTGGATAAEQDKLMAKRKAQAMGVAVKPGQQILMNVFMMYMSGSTLNIFSISTTSMAILSPLTSIFMLHKTFEKYDVDTTTPKLIFVALNLVWLAVGTYKLTAMRLLPTTSADWADSIVWKEMMETTSIPPIL